MSLGGAARQWAQNAIFHQMYRDDFSWCPAPIRLRLLFERHIAQYIYANPIESEGLPIPRTVHAIWFGGDIPPVHARCVASWRQTMPEFEIKIWNETSLAVDSAPFSQAAFRQRDYRKMADYWRLRLLRDHGGVYLDCDVFLHRPLPDAWLSPSLTLFPQSDVESTSFVNNSIIAARRGHPLIAGTLEFIEKRMPCDRDAVWTGPNLLTALYCTLRNHRRLEALNVALADCARVTARKRGVRRPFTEIGDLVALTDDVVCCPTQVTAEEQGLYLRGLARDLRRLSASPSRL